MNRSDPPQLDELEISIIGPGRGESIVVHLGNNDWCVIDSCIPRGSQEPSALSYLRSFGSNIVDRIRLVVATHWHDDHIRGLASILRQAPSALFGCSAALDSDIFFRLVESTGLGVQGNSGVDEFGAILDLLAAKGQSEKDKVLASPQWAITNRRLLHLNDTGRPFSASVTALSPSDSTVKDAFRRLAALIPKPGEKQLRIPNRSPNHTSVVLWIEAGAKRVLLGADLEHTPHSSEGWAAVLTNHQDGSPAELFKIPHHGSKNADCLEVWSKLLSQEPIAVVTPFTAKVRLPTESDVKRLSSRTAQLYCTSSGSGKPPVRDTVVEKTIRRIALERRVLEGQPGHVRVRWKVNDVTPPSVDLFHGAYLIT